MQFKVADWKTAAASGIVPCGPEMERPTLHPNPDLLSSEALQKVSEEEDVSPDE